MTLKSVSKKYALNEFNTIGLVLILYCIFVLFIPLVVGELLEITLGELMWNNINLILAIKLGLMIFGTIIPFSLLKISSRKYMRVSKKIPMSFKQLLIQSLVFFTVTSGAIFAMTAISSYFGISGELVAGVGVSIEPDALDDIVYILTFIFISPILEEYAFRGVLLNTLSKYGKYFALYASAFIFSLAHGSFVEFLPSFIMGVFLGKIALRYKSTKPTTLIHIIFNLLLYISFIVPDEASIFVAALFALIYIVAIGLYFTGTYKRIVVRKSNSNSKVTMMFLTTFTVMASLILFIADSILTALLN